MLCNNIKCKHYRNRKVVDYSRMLSNYFYLSCNTPLVSIGECKYSYCKIREGKRNGKI